MQPALFIWGRKYDETPARHWNRGLKKDGQMQGQTSAKAMSALLTFSMVLVVGPDLLSMRARPQVAALAQPLETRHHVVSLVRLKPCHPTADKTTKDLSSLGAVV